MWMPPMIHYMGIRRAGFFMGIMVTTVTWPNRRVAALGYGLCGALFLFCNVIKEGSAAKTEELADLGCRLI